MFPRDRSPLAQTFLPIIAIGGEKWFAYPLYSNDSRLVSAILRCTDEQPV